MTEGELLKELKRGLPDYFEQTDNKNFITEILEKARKDFPGYLMFDPDYTKSDRYITSQKWTLDQKNAWLKKERDEWLFKYFGDEPE